MNHSIPAAQDVVFNVPRQPKHNDSASLTFCMKAYTESPIHISRAAALNLVPEHPMPEVVVLNPAQVPNILFHSYSLAPLKTNQGLYHDFRTRTVLYHILSLKMADSGGETIQAKSMGNGPWTDTECKTLATVLSEPQYWTRSVEPDYDAVTAEFNRRTTCPFGRTQDQIEARTQSEVMINRNPLLFKRLQPQTSEGSVLDPTGADNVVAEDSLPTLSPADCVVLATEFSLFWAIGQPVPHDVVANVAKSIKRTIPQVVQEASAVRKIHKTYLASEGLSDYDQGLAGSTSLVKITITDASSGHDAENDKESKGFPPISTTQQTSSSSPDQTLCPPGGTDAMVKVKIAHFRYLQAAYWVAQAKVVKGGQPLQPKRMAALRDEVFADSRKLLTACGLSDEILDRCDKDPFNVFLERHLESAVALLNSRTNFYKLWLSKAKSLATDQTSACVSPNVTDQSTPPQPRPQPQPYQNLGQDHGQETNTGANIVQLAGLRNQSPPRAHVPVPQAVSMSDLSDVRPHPTANDQGQSHFRQNNQRQFQGQLARADEFARRAGFRGLTDERNRQIYEPPQQAKFPNVQNSRPYHLPAEPGARDYKTRGFPDHVPAGRIVFEPQMPAAAGRHGQPEAQIDLPYLFFYGEPAQPRPRSHSPGIMGHNSMGGATSEGCGMPTNTFLMPSNVYVPQQEVPVRTQQQIAADLVTFRELEYDVLLRLEEIRAQLPQQNAADIRHSQMQEHFLRLHLRHIRTAKAHLEGEMRG